jgi:CRP/FNR family transcriptional regulator, cyclic AMP receptor protein
MTGRDIRRLLELDPALGAGLEDRVMVHARASLLVRVVELADATAFVHALARDDLAAVLVVDGTITSEIRLGERPCARLYGPGSLLSPQVDPGEVLESGQEWSGGAATVALIDRPLMERAGAWPVIGFNLLARASDETRRLAVDHAIAHLPRAEDRLLYTLWHLAERWGRVSRSGVELPLRLTHETLGRLTGSKRPSVTLALGLLSDQGRIARGRDGGLLLIAPAPELPEAGPLEPAPAQPLGFDHVWMRMRFETLYDAEQHATARGTAIGAETVSGER